MILTAITLALLTAPNTMRVELYREVQRGDPNAGANKHVASDGKVYGMGKAEQRPFIQRCELTLDDTARAGLLQQKLTYMPYFRDSKPEITLGTYFEAQGNADKMRALIPVSLEKYLEHPDASRANLDTVIEPGTQGLSSVTVVWLDGEHWYVDRAYYRFSSFDPGKLQRGACEDVIEGSFEQFMRYSPIINARRTEGSPLRQHPKLGMYRDPKAPALRLDKSAGMPGTKSWELTVLNDGTYGYSRDARPPAGFDPHRLTQLLIAARRAGLTSLQSRPAPPAHDRSETMLRMTIDDKLVNATLSGDSPPLTDFITKVIRAYGLDG